MNKKCQNCKSKANVLKCKVYKGTALIMREALLCEDCRVSLKNKKYKVVNG